MKKSTIITLSGIGLAFVFWMVFPGILSKISVSGQVLDVDPVCKLYTQKLGGIKMQLPKLSYSQKARFMGKYMISVAIKIDDHAERITILTPKELFIARLSAPDKDGLQTVRLSPTPAMNKLLLEGNGEITNKSSENDTRQILNEPAPWPEVNIPISVTMPKSVFNPLIARNNSSHDSQTGLATRLTLPSWVKLIIEHLNTPTLSVHVRNDVWLKHCKATLADIDIHPNGLTLTDTKMEVMNINIGGDINDYRSTNLELDSLSFIGHLIMEGGARVELNKKNIGQLTLHPKGKGIQLYLWNIDSNLTVKPQRDNH